MFALLVQFSVQLEQGALEMDAITYSHARSNLAQTMEKVCDDHAPVIITRKNQRSVVLLSLEDYRALEETAYLLRSPKNARRLLESVAELESGGGTERELVE
jgi:antitoxin YefM